MSSGSVRRWALASRCNQCCSQDKAEPARSAGRGVGQLGAVADQGCVGKAGQGLAQIRIAPTMTALSSLIAWVRDLTAEVLASRNMRSISTGPSPVLAVLFARAHATAWAAGDGVGFAVTAAGGTVGPVDLHHGDAIAAHTSSQDDAVGAGAFHSCALQLAESACPG
jgi:hypothetical protein